MAQISVRNLFLKRGDKTVLDIDTFDITKGDHVLITGPSGSGKSSLLHVLAGLLRFDAGHVQFGDTVYETASDAALDTVRARHFGFVFQGLHLIRHLSVRDNIRLAGKNDISAQLGLADKTGKKISDLSQGEAQRVAIARALANMPNIIFADEPTSALDDANTQTVMDLLTGQAARSGASLIVATHDPRITSYFQTIRHLDKGSFLS